MTTRNISFRKLPDVDKDININSAIESRGIKEPHNTKDESSGVITFRRFHDPKKIQELLEIDDLKELLGHSFLFIQNRKVSSDQLIDHKLDQIWSLFDYSIIDGTTANLTTFFQQLKVRKRLSSIYHRIKNVPEKRPKVFIIDLGEKSHVYQICKRISKVKDLQFGIWLRGYLWDLDPYILTQFDGMFIFDMANREYEILRSAIDISDSVITDLKIDPREINSENKVLFFLNTKRVKQAPLLLENPVILYH